MWVHVPGHTPFLERRRSLADQTPGLRAASGVIRPRPAPRQKLSIQLLANGCRRGADGPGIGRHITRDLHAGWQRGSPAKRHRPSPPVIRCDESNAAPDTCGLGPVGTTAMRLHLGNKRSSGKGIALLVLFHPALIRLPEFSRTAPGTRMHFAAGIQKLLQGIVLTGSRGGYLVESRRIFVLVALVSACGQEVFRTVV